MTLPRARRWLAARVQRPLAGLVGETRTIRRPSSSEGAVGYSFTPWPWEAAPAPEPARSLREALLVGSGICLTRWRPGPGSWEPEARADGLDTLQHFILEGLDRLDALAEMFCQGSPDVLIGALNVLLAVAGDVAPPAPAPARLLAAIRTEARAAAARGLGADRLLPRVVYEILDPDPLAAAQAAQSGVIRVASALGIGTLAEIRRWQDEVLILATPWRPSPPDLGPLVDPLIARRGG